MHILEKANLEKCKLLLSERDFHRMRWCDFETIKRRFSLTRLYFIFELNERDVMSVWNQSNFFKSGESVKIRAKRFVHFFTFIRCKKKYTKSMLTA